MSLWTVHFVRRTLESMFVHKYSGVEVSVADSVQEYLYYWVFAYLIALEIDEELEVDIPTWRLAAGVLIFIFAEMINSYCHVHLARLRTKRDEVSERKLPMVWPFTWLSSPNYSAEILAWVGFNLVTPTWSGIAFMALGAAIMGTWAHAKFNMNRDFFGDKWPASRKIMIPGIW